MRFFVFLLTAPLMAQIGPATDESRRHWLVEFTSEPTIDEEQLLRRRGLSVVGRRAGPVLIATGAAVAAEALGAVRMMPLPPSLKISRELFDAPAARTSEADRDIVAVFHRDVPHAAAMTVLAAEGARVSDHPQLVSSHYLVRADSTAIARLAAWDDVAYLFPASADLANGSPVHACVGGSTVRGISWEGIAKVGPGWAPGRGAARLNFAFGALSTKLESAALRREIERALAEWSKHVHIDWTQIGDLFAPRTVVFRFAKGSAGAPEPFDGPGKTLAYAYFPAPPNPEPLAGDIYLDDDENWRLGENTDLYSVALHEIGHALGLAHADRPGAVMYPYYRRVDALADADIEGVRELYATRGDAIPAPSPTPLPDPSPLPVPGPPPATDRISPKLAILSPSITTVSTSLALISLSGTAGDDTGVTFVRWQTAAGAAGVASGTVRWTAEIPLLRGINQITVRAFDAAGNSAWRSVVVTRR